MSARNTWRHHAVISIRMTVLVAIAALAPFRLMAQEHDHAEHDDHDHDHEGALHFAHPLFTESPSPDTKFRFDYLFRQLASSSHEHSVRLEGEYAFNPSVSLEVNVPLTSRSDAGTTANAVGSGEVALKLASFAAAEKGLLFGGGLALGLPTGSDDKGIGSGHIVEVEPYVDAGYKEGETELVSFLSYSTTTHRHTDEDRENNLSFAFSALYHIAPRFETLAEFEASRALSGDESGTQLASIAAGLKYHLGSVHHLVVGIGGRIPVTSERESKHEVILSALYHF